MGSVLPFTLESLRFKDVNEYEYEIELKVFVRVLKKKDTLESFMFLFFTKKVSRLIYTEGSS